MEQQTQAQNRESRSKISLLLDFAKRLSWFISACVALLAFYFVRKFLFDVIRVNNQDMADTYHYGDALFVKKSFNTIEHGDVVYVEFPLKDNEFSSTHFFQRVLALPGDSFEMREKKVFVNNKWQEDLSTTKHNYIVISNAVKIDSLFMLQHKLNEGGQVSDEFDYSFSLTQEQSITLSKISTIKTVNPKLEKPDNFDEVCFPSCNGYCWNKDFYGKIYVPKKSDTLLLDTLNINLYANLIGDFEKNTLEVRQDSILINSVLTNSYVVKQNYYFLLGDNRDNANDSRVWGYLPENKIKAKVIRRIKRSRK
ncbi:MAG: signal peptidase I [Bacteroidia bacterium]|nr:signal peptidase I [Bacteroidia bacterium]